jgi:hypothetical protein
MHEQNEEIWKVIPSFPNYAVSNLGQVKRLTKASNTYPGKILKQSVATNGYLYVSPSCIKRMVHCLVAEAFIGERPSGYVINHKDFDITNNKVENLEYCTQKENLEHSIDHRPYGDSHKNTKYGEKVVREVKLMLQQGKKQVDIAKAVNMSKQLVNNIATGKAWKWLKV